MVIKNEEVALEVLLAQRMQEVAKDPKLIAEEIGDISEKTVSLIMQGSFKLPVTRLADFARALNMDVRFLLRRSLGEYSKELLELLEQELKVPLLSERELSLVKAFRSMTGDQDINSMLLERDGLLEVICLQ